MNAKRGLYSTWCWTCCAASTAFWGSAALAAGLFPGTGGFRETCMRRWAVDNLWLSRTRVRIDGCEHIDRTRPQIFVANHSGLHDILALAAHLPVPARWVAKKSLFAVPFMGWYMSRCGFVAIDRGNPREAARSLVDAAALLNGGANILAFPEGTRSRTGELGRFQSGAFALALKAGAPLVPVVIDGSNRVIAPKSLQVNPGTVIRIRIGSPIVIAGRDRSDKHRLMDEVYAVMSSLLAGVRHERVPGEESADPLNLWINGRGAASRDDYPVIEARARAERPRDSTTT